ncbi:Rieske (2Fe-2S) protein [Actinomadura sp. SCN-SB]|uniref:Rieske (2Fe-2S) protein n=1 Tax=Actinomadura sp. SCN-SB TaxID=3373092 RepID=UPI003753CA64
MAQAPASRTDGSEAADDADPAPGGETRRGLLIGAGLAGVAGLAAACGGGGGGDDSGGGDSGGGAAGTVLARTSEIPVGGGKIFKDRKVVVVQPVQGQFKAYEATCTHRGCSVESVADGMIDCPCHGSKFKITDGSVASPPADEPLPEKGINVQGDQIMLA